MIVGTAGHIDHGKTTLVRALTGVDTDRLPEEKQRGISIELGYAFLDLPGQAGRIGFVDVPGHQRLVHTMISGATGIDYALLLVAADDGIMPQTREHLAVLSLLGLDRGAIVITKTDRVDAARIASVRAELQTLLAGTALAAAPVLAVSATRGDGLDELRALLLNLARSATRADPAGAAFRLAVDRVFTLAGTGTVVTGSVHAGAVGAGDSLCLVPGARSVRVRSVHAQNRAVEAAFAGTRCALALAGLERHEVERGQWLVAPAVALASDRLDVVLSLWAGESAALRSGTPVHVHLGSASLLGSVALLDSSTLAPGETARAQLVLCQPLGAWHGDRFVLRDASATRTLAGGRVLDPFGATRYRRTPQRLAELDALSVAGPQDRLAAVIAAAAHGVDLRRFAAAQGRALPALPADALHHASAQSEWALGAAQLTQAGQRIIALLAEFHLRHPEELGPDAARLRRLALPRLAEPLWRALLATLLGDGRVQQRGAFLHLPAHGVQLSVTEQRIAQKVAPQFTVVGFEGAWVRDLARSCAEPEALMRVTLARLAQRGELHQVVKDLYLPPSTVDRLGAMARAVAAAQGGELTAGGFRDATQLGRKRAIQILEYLDRIGLLRRVGDVHRVRSDSALFEPTAP